MQPMQPQRFIAYYRVSTQRQGASGLGLEAQQAAVANYLRPLGLKPIAELKEVESGTKSKRPQLDAALKMAEEQGATLLIAKLDRLARSVSFISRLLDGKVPFVSCDMPDANRMMLQISAVFAEHEARMISQRTKDALQAAKARGVILGGVQPSRAAEISAFDERIHADIQALMEEGIEGAAALARALNERGLRTPRGSLWGPGQVIRVLRRKAGA